MNSVPECKESFPPAKRPTGNAPEGVRPFSCSMLSLSSLQKYNNGR